MNLLYSTKIIAKRSQANGHFQNNQYLLIFMVFQMFVLQSLFYDDLVTANKNYNRY